MRYIEAKTIIGKFNNVNIYRGCSHGCIYCDSRSECYQVGDFENIAVKKNALEIFENELNRRKKKCLITSGSMCDPYLHLEKELKLTKQMLDIIKNKYFGVCLLTKSDLILRDIDLIEEINQRNQALVCMTITTFDDDLCQKIERNVTVTSKRFACLEQFAKRGIPIGIWMGPILPFINDTEENIVKIVNKCIEIGVKYIVVFEFGTTKRKGSEEYFYHNLDLYFPGIKEKYVKAYGSNYGCRSFNHLLLWRRFKELCDANKILYDLKEINEYLNKDKTTQLSLF